MNLNKVLQVGEILQLGRAFEINDCIKASIEGSGHTMMVIQIFFCLPSNSLILIVELSD